MDRAVGLVVFATKNNFSCTKNILTNCACNDSYLYIILHINFIKIIDLYTYLMQESFYETTQRNGIK